MEKYLKFLRKLSPDLREKLIDVIEKISQNKTDRLDIKKLSGHNNIYRCRIGQIRIIFQKSAETNIIIKIDFRGGVY